MNPELTNDEFALSVPAVEPETAKPSMAPVTSGERIDTIDILRGMALFGILACNMRGFFAPLEIYGNVNKFYTENIDWIAQGFVNQALQGKFITLFAVLFGVGFAVQMGRAAERGRSISFYPRRLAILLGIGLIHALLIWPGDILFDYAVCGFALLLFRKRQQKTIAIWAVSLFSVSLVMYTGFYIASFFGIKPPGMGGGGAGDPQKFKTMIEHVISIYRDGYYYARVQHNWKEWLDFHSPMEPVFYATYILPRFLAGMWLYRSGLFSKLSEYKPLIKRVLFISLAVGLVTDGIVIYARYIAHVPNDKVTFLGYLTAMSRDISLPSIAAFYASCVLLAVQTNWKRVIAPFAAVGRTALSNYLLQSLFFTLFFHYTKLYGKVGPMWGFLPTVVFFAIQVWLSNWWLSQYQFGPAEWVWRSLTYGKPQPMRKNQFVEAAA